MSEPQLAGQLDISRSNFWNLFWKRSECIPFCLLLLLAHYNRDVTESLSSILNYDVTLGLEALLGRATI